MKHAFNYEKYIPGKKQQRKIPFFILYCLFFILYSFSPSTNNSHPLFFGLISLLPILLGINFTTSPAQRKGTTVNSRDQLVIKSSSSIFAGGSAETYPGNSASARASPSSNSPGSDFLLSGKRDIK